MTLAPSSPELEEAVIGAALMTEARERARDVMRVLDGDCFTRPLWRACWLRIVKAWEDDEPADPVTVALEAARQFRGHASISTTGIYSVADIARQYREVDAFIESSFGT